MSRSIKVSQQHIEQVKLAVKRSGFPRQKDLAESLQLSLATISNFLNGRSVDYLNFYEICQKLGLELDRIADFEIHNANNSYQTLDLETEQAPIALFQEESEIKASNYIERPPIESHCYETIVQPGSLLRIKASKRMGKTWLINNIIHQAQKQNYITVRLSLLLADGTVLKNLDEFLRWFCVVVCRQMKLTPQLDDYWEKGLGSNYNCTLYFEEHLLAQIDRPLVLCLDEVDRIFSYSEIAEDFLGMLRAWHEEAKSRQMWRKLRLILAHSTEAYIPLNINRSPFNVGLGIELPEFTNEQIHELSRRQGLNLDTSQILELMDLVGGHPYLVQRAIYYLNTQKISLVKLLQEADTESGIYNDHLRGHLYNLKQYPELAVAMKKIVNTANSVQLEPNQIFKLQSLGLVKLHGNAIESRCNLYSQYFREHLGKE
ncbi:MAG: AAA-like domain-containing protein [Mojavia pulchra JT2-VF2]|jgi:transcriptional regulator with XRE-family HTH domain|uniref:AAA-like domain-containing protein n=1 Tax=Mojavia pulchra JT2-VF2 TaxID=287848 RepID=A0A951Q6Y0_9NOST|nr:AAA-like domain-containing protein [Mojavia pulchra JT2-VF2]